MAKGMGNGFPIGGILIHPDIKASHGMLGTTFGGNHLACKASLAVLDIIRKEKLQEKTKSLELYFKKKASQIPQIKKIKGRGLMLGLEFDFDVVNLTEDLLTTFQRQPYRSSNQNLIMCDMMHSQGGERTWGFGSSTRTIPTHLEAFLV